MPASIDNDTVTHTGLHRYERAPVVPDSSFGDSQIGTSNPINATKLKHQYAPRLAQAHGSAAATERRVVHVARAAGELTAISAGPVVAAVGDSTVTLDLRKNGTTVLTAVIEIDSGDAAYASVSGGILTAAYVAGDVFEAVLTATVGTGTLPQGVWCEPVFREGPG